MTRESNQILLGVDLKVRKSLSGILTNSLTKRTNPMYTLSKSLKPIKIQTLNGTIP